MSSHIWNGAVEVVSVWGESGQVGLGREMWERFSGGNGEGEPGFRKRFLKGVRRWALSQHRKQTDCAAVLCLPREQACYLWPIPKRWNFRHGKRPLQAPSQIPSIYHSH